MNIAYFAHELADAAVRKRVRMLVAADCTVTLLGFERDRGDGAPSGAANALVLGRTRNAKLVSRIFSVLAAIPRALRAKRRWRNADLIIARNLEMLVLITILARLTPIRARIAYECLDIHRIMFARGLFGASIRAMEQVCLKGVATIITSSPAFEQHHFRDRQHWTGPVLLAENKVLALTPLAEQRAPPESPPWIIAWCGVLRCRRSFEALRALVSAQNGRVHVELWGAPARDQFPDFHEVVAATPHLRFHGAYRSEDLATIYAQAHFAWVIDFYEADGNSQWLLPNRLYESLAFGSTPIALAGVETARWLQLRSVGVVLEAPLEASLDAFMAELTAEGAQALRGAALQLDPNATRLTPDACRAFAVQLLGASA
jgi:hypothetical protein